MTSTAIGVDVGSLGLRVARSDSDCRPVEVGDLVPATALPWITAELRAGSIAFVTARQQRSAEAVHKITAELAAVRERVTVEVGEDVDRVVLTVPARMESRDRIALRDAARAAGFTDVHLINDAIAAVLGTDESGSARTVLVYSLGFSGFEVGLLRIARRQVRVLHHTAADTPSGAEMDHWIMRVWLNSLGKQEIADLDGWTAAEWMRLRAAAADVKHRLVAGEQLDYVWPVWSTEPTAPTLNTPTPDEFHRLAETAIDTTRDSVREVLAEAELTSADIDTVLLVGGCTVLPAVHAMLGEELTGAAQQLGPNHLARGAAVYGARLRPTEAALDQDAEFIDVPERSLRLTNLTLPARALPQDPVEQTDPVAGARRLWSNGKPDDAKALLTALIESANQLLNEIDQSIPAADQTTAAAELNSETEALLAESTPEARARAQRAIDRAARRLRKGRLAEAVSESHHAWKLAPDYDDVFQKMIDIHLEAAKAADTPDDFVKAHLWLNCALGHGRGRPEVVDCLVDRLLAQARYHHGHGRLTDAMNLLEECLHLDPNHDGVQELSAEVAAQPRG